MIKIQLKKNFGYLVVYFFGWLIRSIICIIIEEKFQIKTSDFIFLYLMVLGEIFGGLLIYVYQYNSKRKSGKIKYFGINLIYNQSRPGDNKFKIAFLIFLASFFDIFNYTFSNMYSPKHFSLCVELRLSSIQTVSSALIFIYLLKYKMKTHHKVSLIFLGICICLTIVIDVLFKKKYISLKYFFLSYFMLLYNGFIFSINNSIENYLVDVDYMNPFQILSYEGLFGIILSVLASIGHGEPFNDIIIQCQNRETSQIILIIFLLFLYFLLSMIINAYKVYSNIIFLPMVRALIEYLLNPLFNIYFFLFKLDFNNNYVCFFLSEIICIIISFFGCVYNEYIILCFCGLDKETNYAIGVRATSTENIPIIKPDDLSSNNNNDED